MHIAVCDDNIADRKQLERLLKRESDKRKNDSGLIYTDSFGDSEVLSRTPMQYDLFFVDLTEDNSDANRGSRKTVRFRIIGIFH